MSFYGIQNNRSKAHKILFLSFSFVLHNLIIDPTNKYTLKTIIIGAGILVPFKKNIVPINKIIDNVIKL